jgi:hypothetical protein
MSVIKALRVGQNVVEYATGREAIADKLTVRDVTSTSDKVETPKRGALQIAKLHHADDWSLAPSAMNNLTASLRDKLGLDVVAGYKELRLGDPDIRKYPLVALHGRAGFTFSPENRLWLGRYLEPGGGTLFADAACGSPAFDAAFRRLVAGMLPGHNLVPIPIDDVILSERMGYSLREVQYNKAAGGEKSIPQLEGVELDGRWAVIYSKYDLGCALARRPGADCKGYSHESALRISSNIVIYATSP